MHGDDDYTRDWKKANAPEGGADADETQAPATAHEVAGEEDVASFGSRKRFVAGGVNQNAVRGILVGVGVVLFVILMSIAWLIVPKGGPVAASPTVDSTHLIAADRPGAEGDRKGDVTLTPASQTTTPAPIATVRPLPRQSVVLRQPPMYDSNAEGSADIPLGCRRQISPNYVGEISLACSQYATGAGSGSGPPTRVAQAPRAESAESADDKAAADALKASSMMRSDYMADSGSNGNGSGGASSSANATESQSASGSQVDEGDGLYRVRTGWRIPVALVAKVDMEMSGGVTASVRENVKDTLTGRYTLIPYGSMLIGVNGTATREKRRADIAWTLLRLPNGREIALAKFPGQDALGQQGLDARVDDHRGRIARTSFISAALAAAAGLVTNKQQASASSGGVVVVSTGQQVGTVIADGILRTDDRLVQLDTGLAASISVDPGIEFNVFVDNDIMLPPYSSATASK